MAGRRLAAGQSFSQGDFAFYNGTRVRVEKKIGPLEHGGWNVLSVYFYDRRPKRERYVYEDRLKPVRYVEGRRF